MKARHHATPASSSPVDVARWTAALPGYRGYREPPLRRQDDHMLRAHAAALLRRHSETLRLLLGTAFLYGPEDLLVVTDHLAERLHALAGVLDSTWAPDFETILEEDGTPEPVLEELRQLDGELIHGVLALGAHMVALDPLAACPRRYLPAWRKALGHARALATVVERRSRLSRRAGLPF